MDSALKVVFGRVTYLSSCITTVLGIIFGLKQSRQIILAVLAVLVFLMAWGGMGWVALVKGEQLGDDDDSNEEVSG